MVNLTLVSWPFPVYRGPAIQGPWKQGEVRQVTEKWAEYLCNTFPDCFVRDGGAFDASGLLSCPAKDIVAALEGLSASDLRVALKTEEAGKNRKTVTRAICAALEG